MYDEDFYDEEFDNDFEDEEENKPIRTLAYKRYQRHRTICRKKAICHHQTMFAENLNYNKYTAGRIDLTRKIPFEYYDHDGQYDKGKIHCGCGICKPYKKCGRKSYKQEIQEKKSSYALKDYLVGNY